MSTYTVESVQGCRIIRGSVPLADMVALLGAADEGEQMDLWLAGQTGACMVFGRPEALARLRDRGLPLSPERAAQVARATAAGLSDAAVEWVRGGDRGSSSESMFSHLTGVKLRAPSTYCLPRDVSDFARCRQLLDAVPELQGRVGDLAGIGPGWEALSEAWERLASLMDQEAPNWREGRGSAPETSAALRAVLESETSSREPTAR